MLPFDRHKKALLAFSGGKDSLACLHLLQEHWERFVVAWVNTGDAFPETIAQMREIAAMVPSFIEIRSNQPAQIERHGWPVEVLPITRTMTGREVDGHQKQLMQPYLGCCLDNIWRPMMDFINGAGITLVFRGTRLTDGRKSSVRDGDVVGGIEYRHPIEDWTAQQVKDFLTSCNVPLPAHYAETETSLDCRLCTGYLHENVGKMRYMRRHHPAEFEEIQRRIRSIRDAVVHETTLIEGALL